MRTSYFVLVGENKRKSYFHLTLKMEIAAFAISSPCGLSRKPADYFRLYNSPAEKFVADLRATLFLPCYRLTSLHPVHCSKSHINNSNHA
jgi:hypothetical protein